MRLETNTFKSFVLKALEEDASFKDLTSKLLIPRDLCLNAQIHANEDCVVCGLDLARFCFEALNPNVLLKSSFVDGQKIKKGQVVLKIFGKARAILSAERVAINFLSHLSGISTLTDSYVKLANKKVKILDTRKTIPLLRILEKYAVRCGGGFNHRLSLADLVLVKDNHKKILEIKQIKLNTLKNLNFEIEAQGINDFKNCLKSGAKVIMLDNMNLGQIKTCVRLRNRLAPEVKLEASGRINLRNIKRISYLGVDFISIGALTHSSRAIDFSLDFPHG
jgi:nicotinate-nucleotide pyrophosphorylase (carboxylating)